MELFLAIILFCFSIAVLIFSTNVFLRSAGQIGLAINVSPFVVGAVIVAFGTSLPEALISIFSVWNGIVDVPIAQTIGSNIANILLVLGGVTLVVRRVLITKNLTDIEISLIAAITSLFVFVVLDGVVSFYEGLFLVVGFIFYIAYVFLSKDNRTYPLDTEDKLKKVYSLPKEVGLFILMIAVIGAATYLTILSMQSIANSFSISEGFVAITALALGTSLPELIVSIQAAIRKEIEIVIGAIIGSNAFNILFVVGVPALITDLTIDSSVLNIGLPFLIATTILFVISSLSSRIHIWEGLFYLLIYLLFIIKLFMIL